MEESPDFEQPNAIKVAQDLWGDSNTAEGDRIPVWLDCDTGHDVGISCVIAELIDRTPLPFSSVPNLRA
jgi:hypothetical protein